MKFKLAALAGAVIVTGLFLGAVSAQSDAGGAAAMPGADEPSVQDLAGLTGSDRPEEVIYARRLAMTMIGQRIYTLSLMAIPGAEFHADVAENDLLDIGFLLNIFPHLFPPETDTMPEEDVPGELYVTNARPRVWEEFDTFYDRAIAAGDLAFAALRADPGPDFEQAIAALQGACDSCHADYRRTRSTYGIPIPPLD